ncbi:MAG TPA: hypothetical protein VK183_07140 [Flavobacterium sp.]|nr:hypothetical protein [Flavobacterium sp.]
MKKLFFLGLLLCASVTHAQSKEKSDRKPAAVNKSEAVSDSREEEKKAARKGKREARKEARDKAVKGRRYYIDANGTKTYMDEA